jgi:N6-adenosine-specific RNA methylase IME4
MTADNPPYVKWDGLTPPYRTIVADPPWPYPEGFAGGPGHGKWKTVSLPYSPMALADIEALPVASLSDRDCRLFLWATNRYLPAGLQVLARWGFAYKQTLTWSKPDSNLGGSVAPTSAEFLLVAVKGSPPVMGRWPASVVEALHPRSHSTKPPAFLDIVERVSPGPYVELFARSPRLGWDHWGLGYEAGSEPIALDFGS